MTAYAQLRRMQPWLGTFVHVEAGGDPAALDRAIDAAFAAVAQVHRAMSFYSTDSDLAHLHAHASRRPTRVSRHTWTVLARALELAEKSGGLFDPSIALRMVDSGLLPRPSGPQADPRADLRDVMLLDGCRVQFRRPLWLDLGGIAKGYAVDCAVDVLMAHGMEQASVNAGGDLRCVGRELQPVAIRHPADPTASIPLGQVRQAAVATSGEFILGRPGDQTGQSPLVHPFGPDRPARHRSITVLAAQCWLADGLTKIVSLLGSAAQPILAGFGAEAAVADESGQLHASPGFWAALGRQPPPESIVHA